MQKTLNATRYAIDLNGERLPIIIRKHPSSRRMVIRYQPLRHCLSLTLPRSASLKQGLHFVEKQRGWIQRQLAERAAFIRFEEGAVLPVLGTHYTLVHTGGRGVVKIEGDRLLIPGEKEFMERRVRDWLIKTVRTEITRLAAEKSVLIGRSVKRISLRDTVSHWGSCSHDGSLSFSWRLVFAPPEVLDYIVCHEVAHLAEHNHSPAFWAQVENLCPGWRPMRDWIKEQGASLYLYG